MNNIFGHMSGILNEGRQVSVVSLYRDSGVERSLVLEDDYEARGLPCRSEEGLSFTSGEGGFMMVEHYLPKPRLVILGGGHIALPLSRIGAILGFRVAVFDDRLSFANKDRFPDAETVICESFDDLGKCLKITPSDYVIIVTRGHKHDALCLRDILNGGAPR